MKTIKNEYKKVKLGSYSEPWRTIRLGDIITCIKGNKPLKMASANNRNCLPYLSTEYLRENKPNKFVYDLKSTIIINDGDLILLWDGSNAGEFFLGKNGILSSTMAKMEIIKEVYDNKFLFYILKQREQYLKGLTKGTGIPHVDGYVLNNLSIPFPPILEQKKIAEILSTVDEAVEKVSQAIDGTEKLKKGLINELLTKGIGHKEFKEADIEIIPKTWTLVRLGDVCHQRNEVILPSGKGDYKYVGLEHIKSGEINLDLHEMDINIKSTKFRFYEGDILYGKLRPYLDKAVSINFSGICSTDLLVLKPIKNKTLVDFIIWIIHSNKFIQHAILTTSGTNHPRTSWSAISKFRFYLPPLPEQKEIVEVLNRVSMRRDILRNRKEKLERVKKGLMNDLLTGRKRVKVEA
jgi:type I restriction enzyme S subunit